MPMWVAVPQMEDQLAMPPHWPLLQDYFPILSVCFILIRHFLLNRILKIFIYFNGRERERIIYSVVHRLVHSPKGHIDQAKGRNLYLQLALPHRWQGPAFPGTLTRRWVRNKMVSSWAGTMMRNVNIIGSDVNCLTAVPTSCVTRRSAGSQSACCGCRQQRTAAVLGCLPPARRPARVLGSWSWPGHSPEWAAGWKCSVFWSLSLCLKTDDNLYKQ